MNNLLYYEMYFKVKSINILNIELVKVTYDNTISYNYNVSFINSIKELEKIVCNNLNEKFVTFIITLFLHGQLFRTLNFMHVIDPIEDILMVLELKSKLKKFCH